MTLEQILDKLQVDLDLQDAQFITRSELIAIVNEAIRDAEAEIHKIGLEDNYFLASSTLTLVSGEGAIDLPDDIYATKLRGVHYENGSLYYEIKRFRGVRAIKDFLEVRKVSGSGTKYRYLLTNNASEGVKLALAPIPQESGERGTMWYIRNAKQLAVDADECDIPEFINFVLQFAKDKCINKERMTPDAPESQALMAQRALMISTLTEQVPDGDNEIISDISHYEDSI